MFYQPALGIKSGLLAPGTGGQAGKSYKNPISFVYMFQYQLIKFKW
jgi:hypothetical protein